MDDAQRLTIRRAPFPPVHKPFVLGAQRAAIFRSLPGGNDHDHDLDRRQIAGAAAAAHDFGSARDALQKARACFKQARASLRAFDQGLGIKAPLDDRLEAIKAQCKLLDDAFKKITKGIDQLGNALAAI